jgi:hypothetical protein
VNDAKCKSKDNNDLLDEGKGRNQVFTNKLSQYGQATFTALVSCMVALSSSELTFTLASQAETHPAAAGKDKEDIPPSAEFYKLHVPKDFWHYRMIYDEPQGLKFIGFEEGEWMESSTVHA